MKNIKQLNLDKYDSEKLNLENELLLLDKEYWTTHSSIEELRKKKVVPFYSVFIIGFYLFSFFDSFDGLNYWVIPTGVFVLYLIVKIYVWWDELKDCKRKLLDLKQRKNELIIECDTYDKVLNVLIDEVGTRIQDDNLFKEGSGLVYQKLGDEYSQEVNTSNNSMNDIWSIYRLMFVGSGFGYEDLTCEQKEEILNKVFNYVRQRIDKEKPI